MSYKNCPSCGGALEEGYLRCPRCSKHLLMKCPVCEALLEAEWIACPYCGIDVSFDEIIRMSSRSSVPKKQILTQENDNSPEEDKSQPKILIAIDPHSSPNTLRKIAEEELRNNNGGEDYFLRQALLKNLNTPSEFLYDLSFYNGKQKLLGEYLGNRNVNPEELSKIFYNINYYDKKKQITKDAMASLASNPSCPSGILCQLMDEKEFGNEVKIVEGIAENPNSPEYLLLMIIDYHEDKIRARVSRNPASSKEIFERLINGSLIEKESVASSPYIPDLIMKILISDSNKYVREKLAFNSKTLLDYLRVLSEDPEPIVRQSVSKNPNTSIELLKQMLAVEADVPTRDAIMNEINKRENNQVISIIKKSEINISKYEDLDIQDKIKLIINKDTSLDILKKLAMDPNYEVRFSLACNKNTPVEILLLLTESKENRILECLLNNNNSTEDIKIISQIKIETNSNNNISIEKEGNNFSLYKDIHDPEVESLYGEGRDALKRKLYTDAILYFTKVIELCPNHDRAYASRAEAHMEEKKYIDAINDINMALNHDPGNIVYEQKKQSWMMMERLKRLGRIK